MIRFGDCVLDTQNHVLHRDGQSTRLQRKVFQLLHYLLQHHGQTVSKEEIFEQLWPGKAFSNSTLETTMKTVRQAIGDSGRIQRYIQTSRGYGYRFVEAVEETEAFTTYDGTLTTVASDHIDEAVPPASSQEKKETPSVKKAKILVVDDEPQIVELLAHILSQKGVKVFTADNGTDAIAIATKEKPDMVILDIEMPIISGFNALDEIKKLNINTRIILFSGKYTDTDTAVESMKKGADDFLPKPFKVKKLLEKITTNLDI